MNPTRSRSIACVADRFGRNPYGTAGNPPRRSVPAPASPPAAPPCPAPWVSPAAASRPAVSRSPPAAPATGDTPLPGGHHAVHATCGPRHRPPPRPTSSDPPRPRPCSLCTRSHASHRTSTLQTRSNRAWKRRPEDCLAAVHSARCSSRTFTTDGLKPVAATTGLEARSGLLDRDGPGHALTLTRSAHVIEVRALPSRRVVLHADHRYYDPLGLPLPSKGFHHRLIPLVFARRRPGRRVSPVPDQTVHTCRLPYPGGTRQADPGTGPDRHGLRRDMNGSAPPLCV